MSDYQDPERAEDDRLQRRPDEYSAGGLFDDGVGFDIDSALAAVANVGELPPMEAEREADFDHETVRRVDAVAPAFVPTAYTPTLAMPPMLTLRRGQLGSLIPALLLIVLGVWLTLTLTNGQAVDSTLLTLAAGGGVLLTLLAAWLGNRRWARGVLFFVFAALGIGAVIYAGTLPNGLDLVRGYPILLSVIGLAMLLATLLARPLDRRLFAPALILVVLGLIGFIVTRGLLPASFFTLARDYYYVPLIIALLLLVLPLLFRRRG